ncbi:MAG: hypothetical protein Q8M99_11820 [Methylotenera sp.]|nr:hypothetical protein [Methylotenera sp.]
MAKDKESLIEVALLRDSALGECGSVVSILKTEVEAYKLHGMVDDNAEAVSYAKSQIVVAPAAE